MAPENEEFALEGFANAFPASTQIRLMLGMLKLGVAYYGLCRFPEAGRRHTVYKMRQTNDAITAIQYGVKRLPDSELPAMNFARVYLQSGVPEKDRAVLLNLLETSPKSESARKALRKSERR